MTGSGQSSRSWLEIAVCCLGRKAGAVLVVDVAGCGRFLWGKSRGLDEPYPLLAHLLDAGAAAEVLSGRLLSDVSGGWLADVLGLEAGGGVGDVHRFLGLMAGWHDVGKASPGFQAADLVTAGKLAESVGGGFSDSVPVAGHARVGQLAVALRGEGSGFGSAVVGGHHGEFGVRPRSSFAAALLGRVDGGSVEWGSLRSELLAVTSGVVGCGGEVRGSGSAVGLLVVTGFVSIADWLVSEEDWLVDRSAVVAGLFGVDGPRDWFRVSRGLLEDRMVEVGLGSGPMRASSFSVLFPGLTARGVQAVTEQALSDAVLGSGGIVAVMAPTGEGKTEAGLLAAGMMGEASGRSGLYVALPTMATADQMLGRVQAFVAGQTDDDVSITLNHGLASLDLGGLGGSGSVSAEADARFAAASWLRGRHRAMLAPVAVGTVDQVLVAALAVRYGFIRHVALFDKVVIIDEAHAYDSYMQALMVRVMEWFGAYQVPVVLLSATLPTKTAQALLTAYKRGWHMDPEAVVDGEACYPGVVGWFPKSGSLSVVDSCPVNRQLPVEQVRYGGGQGEVSAVLGVLDEVYAEDLVAGVAVVVNTVAAAQQIYGAVRDRFAGDGLPVWLLHSRFTIGDRAGITDEIVARFGKDSECRAGVVVATQVIEQSLDLDFDLIVSELAPVGQLLQRAGRCHRHDRPSRPRSCGSPVLKVLTPWVDDVLVLPRAWNLIYHEAELRRTVELLGESRVVRIPGDVQGLVDFVNATDFGDPDALIAAAEMERFASDAQDRAVAGQVMIPSPWNVDLSNQDALTSPLDADQFAATRLGVSSELVVFVDEDGCLFDGSLLPADPGRSDVRRVVVNAVPVPGYAGSWVHEAVRAEVPESWQEWPRLRDVVLVAGASEGDALRVLGDGWSVELSHDYGLEKL